MTASSPWAFAKPGREAYPGHSITESRKRSRPAARRPFGLATDEPVGDITEISTSGDEAYIFGHASVGSANYSANYSVRLHLVDAGEPGTSDRLELLVSNGYSPGVGETIDDGNIQMH
jgi:hypothetical protein